MKRRHALALRLALSLALCLTVCLWGLFGCVDDTSGAASAVNTLRPASADLLILRSDYSSTSLSWARSETAEVLSHDFFHSGTVVNASGLALSGDVVLPSAGFTKDSAAVLDRGQSLITWVGGAAPLPAQWVVAEGFNGNPQDLFRLPDGGAAVVRAQSDPSPPVDAEGGDTAGDDVIVFDAQGAPRGTIPLATEATLPDGFAFAGRGHLRGDELWLPLASFSKDFTQVGPAKVVVISLSTFTVTRRFSVPGLRNCTTLRASGDAGVVGTCSGSYRASATEQREQSGLFSLPWAAAPDSAATVILSGDTWSKGGGVGFEVVPTSLSSGWFVRWGSIDEPTSPDRIYHFDAGDKLEMIYQAEGPFRIGQLIGDSDRLWFTERLRTGGDVVALELGVKPVVLTAIPTPPGALPAVGLARMR